MAGYEPTPEQQEILDHDRATHARLLAGPGTGKSATVVALILKLLESLAPPSIRPPTFTRAATAELAHKVSEHPELTVDRPSTIHSFAISALLRNPGAADFPSPLRIADEWEMHNLIEPELARMVGVTPSFVQKKLIPEMAANWESLESHKNPDVDEQTRNRFVGHGMSIAVSMATRCFPSCLICCAGRRRLMAISKASTSTWSSSTSTRT